MLAHPAIGSELVDLGSFKASGMSVIDILQGSADFELSVFESGRQASVLFPKALTFDEKRQAFFEVQVANVTLAALFLQSVSHAFQAHDPELFQGLVLEHKDPELEVIGLAPDVLMRRAFQR
jgi:hypothetical protein